MRTAALTEALWGHRGVACGTVTSLSGGLSSVGQPLTCISSALLPKRTQVSPEEAVLP